MKIFQMFLLSFCCSAQNHYATLVIVGRLLLTLTNNKKNYHLTPSLANEPFTNKSPTVVHPLPVENPVQIQCKLKGVLYQTISQSFPIYTISQRFQNCQHSVLLRRIVIQKILSA